MKAMKMKIISVMLIFCLIATVCITPVTGSDDISGASVYGDVNYDSQINASDALLVLKCAAKLTEEFDIKTFAVADVNGDESADAKDALEILKYAAKIIDRFSCEDKIESTDVPDTTETPDTTIPPEVTETMKPINTTTPNPEIIDPDFTGTVWIVGDSIAAKHNKTASVRPLYGWGEVIGEYYTSDVTFENKAISSQSTSSYYSLERLTYDYVYTNIKENDYIIISFGHNDHNSGKLDGFSRITDPEADSDTELSYKWWLKNYYIDPALKKGATPILMSSVVRCSHTPYGSFIEEEKHLKYGKAMQELVEEYAEQGITIYFIDAQTYTYNLYSSLRMSEARLYHGQYGPEGGSFFDNTHYSEAGARMISDFIVTELMKLPLCINKYLK